MMSNHPGELTCPGPSCTLSILRRAVSVGKDSAFTLRFGWIMWHLEKNGTAPEWNLQAVAMPKWDAMWLWVCCPVNTVHECAIPVYDQYAYALWNALPPPSLTNSKATLWNYHINSRGGFANGVHPLSSPPFHRLLFRHGYTSGRLRTQATLTVFM